MTEKRFTTERVRQTLEDGSVRIYNFVCDENDIRVLELTSSTDCKDVAEYINDRWFE